LVLAAQQVTKELLTLSDWHGEDAEAQVNDVDRATLIELPTMTNFRRKRHLPGCRDDVTLNRWADRHDHPPTLGELRNSTKRALVRLLHTQNDSESYAEVAQLSVRLGARVESGSAPPRVG
jgi:hypothetical protein